MTASVTQTPSAPLPPGALQGAARLDHLGVIRVQGEDAASFLHGQLTQDFALLGLSEARLAGFCSAKGRLQASFVGFKRNHQEVLLVCQRDLLATSLKRLSMFVLRAKARLTDATGEFQVWGLAAASAPADWPAQPWGKRDDGDASLVRLYPGAGLARALWLAPAADAGPGGPQLDADQWDWLEVMSGVVLVSQPVFEAFVPQMLNYESVGGVNFKKGCYPGQEVVARSQFRGTLKRRAYVVRADSALMVGDAVFHDSDAEQPCGTVAAAAPDPAGGWNAVVSMQTSAAEGPLTVGSANGQGLRLLPLPYELLADI
ncbi:MAG: folate-binding protein [Hydrogenophaga sp.]|nr:folate-binding protein [Hydrogenophaga sp.]